MNPLWPHRKVWLLSVIVATNRVELLTDFDYYYYYYYSQVNQHRLIATPSCHGNLWLWTDLWLLTGRNYVGYEPSGHRKVWLLSVIVATNRGAINRCVDCIQIWLWFSKISSLYIFVHLKYGIYFGKNFCSTFPTATCASTRHWTPAPVRTHRLDIRYTLIKFHIIYRNIFQLGPCNIAGVISTAIFSIL